MTGAFLHYPNSTPYNLSGQTNVSISAKSFVSSPSQPAIRLTSCTGVHIFDCDFDGTDGGIYLLDCHGQILIEDCRFRNIGFGVLGSGHSNMIQLNQSTDNGTGGIRRIRGIGGHTEDMISIYQSGGIDNAHRLVIEDSAFESPLPPDAHAYVSGSGSAIMLGDQGGSFITCQNNTVLNAGQCGIGNSYADHCSIHANVIYGAQRTHSNVGIALPFLTPSYVGADDCSNNRVWWKNAAGADAPLFNGGTAGTITGLSPQTNTLMDATIVPADLHVVLDDGATVSSDAPAVGGIAGGTTVVLTGAGFTGATSVKFGGVDAASFNVDNDNQITCVSPAHAAGTVQIVVA